MARYRICVKSLFVLASFASGAFAQEQTLGVPPQGQGGEPAPFSVPRTPDGQPDLQGVWDFSTITPLQRPANLAGREFLTDQEIAELEQKAAVSATDEARLAALKNAPRADQKGFGPAYNSFWSATGTKWVATKRTSLIVDPPDGRIPPLVPEAEVREAARAKTREHPQGPEDFDLNDRCIVGFNSGPPMLPDAYNNNIQIFQSRTHVVILNEMIHNARVVPLDGRPHIGSSIQQWVGDSRGHWEGNTLVVDTTNFSDEGLGLMMAMSGMGIGRFFGSGDKNLHVVERFTRLEPDLLLYEATLTDPTTWTKPWTVSLTMTRTNAIFEYACHEGNHALPNTLSGERADERLRLQKR